MSSRARPRKVHQSIFPLEISAKGGKSGRKGDGTAESPPPTRPRKQQERSSSANSFNTNVNQSSRSGVHSTVLALQGRPGSSSSGMTSTTSLSTMSEAEVLYAKKVTSEKPGQTIAVPPVERQQGERQQGERQQGGYHARGHQTRENQTGEKQTAEDQMEHERHFKKFLNGNPHIVAALEKRRENRGYSTKPNAIKRDTWSSLEIAEDARKVLISHSRNGSNAPTVNEITDLMEIYLLGEKFNEEFEEGVYGTKAEWNLKD